MKPVLRFIATGDLQIHAWKQFSYTMKNGMNSRLHNCLEVFDVIRRVALERKIDKVLINGDLFEEGAWIETETYDATYRKIESLHKKGIEFLFNLGNHDTPVHTSSRLVHPLRPFKKLGEVVEAPKKVWSSLWILPHSPDQAWIKSGIKGFLDSMERDKASCLILHCGVQGAKTGPADFMPKNSITLEDLYADRFRLVILSDYHKQQFLSRNVLYLGSPLQHSFAETHNPRIWVVKLYDRIPWFKLKGVETNLPRFMTTRSSTLLEHPEKFRGNYVKILAKEKDNASDEAIEKLARRYGFLFQISHEAAEKSGTHSSPTLHSIVPDKIIKKYVKSVIPSGSSRLVSLGKSLYNG